MTRLTRPGTWDMKQANRVPRNSVPNLNKEHKVGKSCSKEQCSKSKNRTYSRQIMFEEKGVQNLNKGHKGDKSCSKEQCSKSKHRTYSGQIILEEKGI